MRSLVKNDIKTVSTHSRAEAAAATKIKGGAITAEFQHTAARRRLRKSCNLSPNRLAVSTHSRAEAAAVKVACVNIFNLFQHTAARRRLRVPALAYTDTFLFQHTAARRRLRFVTIVTYFQCCFNTQPRGGGCVSNVDSVGMLRCFNTQPRGGGCYVP